VGVFGLLSLFEAKWAIATAVLAATGGTLFTVLGWPAGWLMGAMLAVALAALRGMPVGLPPGLREVAFLLLGISIGSAVTPEGMAAVRAWPGSIALLCVSVAATLMVAAAYLERIHGWDRTTARFAAMPGAFSSVVVIAATSSADLPRVILAQSLRVFTLVALMPPILSLTNADPIGQSALAEQGSNTLAEALAVFAVSSGLALAMNRLRIPAGTLLGAMIASAVLHATGLVHGRFPQPLVVIGFIATGAVIGARFRGTSFDTVRRTVPGAAASVLLALAISAVVAALGAWLLDLPFGQLWLAYAPGGVEAMAAMALALSLDPAFVGAHHVLRILGLNAVSASWLRRQPRPPSS
jgi:membrane AbrB-like protein